MKHMPGTVWRLMLAYSLMMAGTSLMVLLAGIIGTDFDLEQRDGFNFILQGGAGIQWLVTNRTALTVSYLFHHISNAGIQTPNEGFNQHMILFGPTFFFD